MIEDLRIAALKKELESAYHGSQWHSFISSVRGLTADEACWKPEHYRAFPWMDGSILNIIFHIGGDSLYQLDYALGGGKLTWPDLQRQFEQDGGNLQAALALAERGYRALLGALDSLDSARLAEMYKTPEGKGQRSIEDFFRMMIEHHYYHAGQIVYIRSMFSGLKSG